MECHDENLPSEVNTQVKPEMIEKTPTADKNFLKLFSVKMQILPLLFNMGRDGMGF